LFQETLTAEDAEDAQEIMELSRGKHDLASEIESTGNFEIAALPGRDACDSFIVSIV
jgi:hypothetical protein